MPQRDDPRSPHRARLPGRRGDRRLGPGVAATATNNLGFPRGGQLAEVDVAVGDQVRAGQVLAKIDDFSARQALEQARAALDGQEAAYRQALDNTAVDGAGTSLAQARRILRATQGQVDATRRADDAAIADVARTSVTGRAVSAGCG